ncbi:MAG: hypothetical protein HPY53_06850 [Brevinematales bacterium]|nr:hypothetical protein [Brevinematales bacterium]
MNKGFRYTLEPGDIRAYIKLPVEEKLEWLEEMFVLTTEAQTGKEKHVREFFRADVR